MSNLKILAVWALGQVIFLAAREPQIEKTPKGPFDGAVLVDLSHQLDANCPVYPGGIPFRLRPVNSISEGYLLNSFTMGEHVATHVDAPAHFDKRGDYVSDIPLKKLNGPLVLIDVRKECEADADFEVQVKHLTKWEGVHGAIPSGAFIVVQTGWEERWKSAEKYLNADENGVLHFPGVSEAAAEFLIHHRMILGIGIDTLSTDPGNSTSFPEHQLVLSRGKIHIENMCNLCRLPAHGAHLVVAPLPIARGSGAPARVFAIVPSG